MEKSTRNKNIVHSLFNRLPYIAFALCFFFFGTIVSTLYWNNTSEEDNSQLYSNQAVLHASTDVPEAEGYVPNESIVSPLNGLQLNEYEYERNVKNIPHAVMISNNASARDVQHSLSYADIVYEAEVEGGITRFMALFWNNQEDYVIKPVRSVRKYFFDWALEYGNIPVTFSGFAETEREDTNSFGTYQKYNIRATYWDWPFSRDIECLKDHPSMHCKYTSPETLYSLFENHGWTYDSWEGYDNQSAWLFSDTLSNASLYEEELEFAYDFGWENEWSTIWKYNSFVNAYEKYDHEDIHLDQQNDAPIRAKTVIIQLTPREYTFDEDGRVAYKTVGSGDAFILRDGRKIEAFWEKKCETCRTRYFKKTPTGDIGTEVSLKPGLIWIAVVPSDREVRWELGNQYPVDGNQ